MLPLLLVGALMLLAIAVQATPIEDAQHFLDSIDTAANCTTTTTTLCTTQTPCFVADSDVEEGDLVRLVHNTTDTQRAHVRRMQHTTLSSERITARIINGPYLENSATHGATVEQIAVQNDNYTMPPHLASVSTCVAPDGAMGIFGVERGAHAGPFGNVRYSFFALIDRDGIQIHYERLQRIDPAAFAAPGAAPSTPWPAQNPYVEQPIVRAEYCGTLSGPTCTSTTCPRGWTCNLIPGATDWCACVGPSSLFNTPVEALVPAPAGWTCNPVNYGTGDRCDCGCGCLDPDCLDNSLPIYGCNHVPGAAHCTAAAQ